MYWVWTLGVRYCRVRTPVEPNFKAGPRQEASSCQPYSTSGICLPSVGFVGRQAAFMGSDLARDPPVPAGSISHSSDKR